VKQDKGEADVSNLAVELQHNVYAEGCDYLLEAGNESESACLVLDPARARTRSVPSWSSLSQRPDSSRKSYLSLKEYSGQVGYKKLQEGEQGPGGGMINSGAL
jgi:hypothetical protein